MGEVYYVHRISVKATFYLMLISLGRLKFPMRGGMLLHILYCLSSCLSCIVWGGLMYVKVINTEPEVNAGLW